MKRSEINRIMRSADKFIRSRGFYLPPFAYWTHEDWQTKGPEVAEIVENNLGWDITDFGQGDFYRFGLFLFTIRNGNLKTAKDGKSYAEKLMIVETGQITPMHFHWSKAEDIINRGGGNLAIQLYNSTADELLDRESTVYVSTDGVTRTLLPGSIVRLSPGESITLTRGLYHKFWAEEERTLVGEVSSVNDDTVDNRFYEQIGRFPNIEDDEPPLYLLVGDYARFYHGKPM
jgi:D-lyxose ketol-isomerase